MINGLCKIALIAFLYYVADHGEITYWRPVCQTIWGEVWSRQKAGSFIYCHNAQQQLVESKYFIVCALLATGTFILWRNMLTSICQSTECHFKHSVDMLITLHGRIIEWHQESFVTTANCWQRFCHCFYKCNSMFIVL